MKSNAVEQDRRSERLDELTALVRAKVAPEQQDALVTFVRDYYARVDPDDLAERQLSDLYGAALSHWNFARKREPGRARVRAVKPTNEEQGWQTTHTINEIVNDDKPFLVASDARPRRNAHRRCGSRCAGCAARIVHSHRSRQDHR